MPVMADSYKKFKQIVVDNYPELIKKIDNKPDGIIAVTFSSLKKESGNLKWETIQHELKYALYVFDLWLEFSEYAPRKERNSGQERIFYIRKIQPKDKLPPSLKTLCDADRSKQMWRKKRGLL